MTPAGYHAIETALAQLAAYHASETAFLRDVLRLLQVDTHLNPGTELATLGQAWMLLADQIVRWRVHLDHPEMRRTELVRERLVAIAAICWRAARDLGIESRGEAIGKDIPF